MYHIKTDDRTFEDDKKTQAILPARAKADHAMAYAKELFKRLTGYPVEERHVRGAGADGAMAYADDIFARMWGKRPDHPYDYGYYLDDCPLRDGYAARGGHAPGTRADWAMTYAKDLFKRRFPAREPFGADRHADTVRQQRHEHPSRPDGYRRDDGVRPLRVGATAKVQPSCSRESSPVATAVRQAMMRLALLIRRSILEPYARRRRRKIAIAQLQALDDRLLADIGVRRNDIERTVDRLLARRDERMATPAALPLPTEECREAERMAA